MPTKASSFEILNQMITLLRIRFAEDDTAPGLVISDLTGPPAEGVVPNVKRYYVSACRYHADGSREIVTAARGPFLSVTVARLARQLLAESDQQRKVAAVLDDLENSLYGAPPHPSVDEDPDGSCGQFYELGPLAHALGKITEIIGTTKATQHGAAASITRAKAAIARKKTEPSTVGVARAKAALARSKSTSKKRSSKKPSRRKSS